MLGPDINLIVHDVASHRLHTRPVNRATATPKPDNTIARHGKLLVDVMNIAAGPKTDDLRLRETLVGLYFAGAYTNGKGAVYNFHRDLTIHQSMAPHLAKQIKTDLGWQRRRLLQAG